MTIDLSPLSIDELNALIADAQRLIKVKQKSSIKQARAQIVQIAAGLGLSVEELLAGEGGEPIEVKTRKKVEPRYRNPDNPNETWTGRGREPRWLVAALAAGKKLEDFLIEKAA